MENAEKKAMKEARKAEKTADALKKAEIKEDKKNLKDDEQYLNSAKRVAKRFVFSILEYIVMFIALSIIVNYLKNGSVNLADLPDTIAKYLKPGSVLFTALVAFLPIMALENIGIYFGLGTVPRMVFGIIKCLALIVWLNLVAISAGDIDVMKMSGLEGGFNGVESFTVNVEPLVKLLSLILLLCCLIPVGEFIGCRKKHLVAVARHDERLEKVKAHDEEEKMAKEARKRKKRDDD